MARLTIPDEQTFATFTVVTSTSAFPITFSLFAKADLTVLVDGVTLDQSAFTFTGTVLEGGGYDGGTVTLNTAVTSGTVRIERNVAPARTSNFAPASTTPVGTVDQALNRATAIQQDHKRRLDAAEATLDGFTDDVTAAAEDAAAAETARAAAVVAKTAAETAETNAETARDEAVAATTNKLNLNGDNVAGNAGALRAAIGADLAANVNYTPAGTGAVARPLQTKLRDDLSLNLRDFGVTLDGTTDDRVNIIKAIDAADASGRELVWPKGTARITAPITETVGVIRWRGEGCTILCDFSTDQTYGMQLTIGAGAHSIKGDGLSVNGNAKTHLAWEIRHDAVATGTTFYGENLGASNAEMQTAVLEGSAGISFRGGYDFLHLVSPTIDRVMMRTGAGSAGNRGVTGLLINYIPATTGAYTRRTLIERPKISRVYPQTASYQYDMDGIGFFASPGIAASSSLGHSSIEVIDGDISSCWGRLIKTQAGWSSVVRLKGMIDEAPTAGIIFPAVDFQAGSGEVVNPTFVVDGVAVETSLVRFSALPETVPMNSAWNGGVVRIISGGTVDYGLTTDPDCPGEPTYSVARDVSIQGTVGSFLLARTNGYDEDMIDLSGVVGTLGNNLARIEAKSGGSSPYRAVVNAMGCRNLGTAVPMFLANISGVVAQILPSADENMRGFTAANPYTQTSRGDAFSAGRAMTVPLTPQDISSPVLNSAKISGGYAFPGAYLADATTATLSALAYAGIASSTYVQGLWIIKFSAVDSDAQGYAIISVSSSAIVTVLKGTSVEVGTTADPGTGKFRIWRSSGQPVVSNNSGGAITVTAFGMG